MKNMMILPLAMISIRGYRRGYSHITDGNACLKIKIIIKPLREMNLGEAQA